MKPNPLYTEDGTSNEGSKSADVKGISDIPDDVLASWRSSGFTDEAIVAAFNDSIVPDDTGVSE